MASGLSFGTCGTSTSKERISSFEIPAPALHTLRTLEAAGYESWMVGGFVRDSLRGAIPQDIDIASTAKWQDASRILREAGFSVHETGTKHGTITAVFDRTPIEITTLRTEGNYSDRRHPDSVHFTDRIEDDLARRDFTINALAYHPDRGLLDPFDGKGDLDEKRIRCVGEPRVRFSEDALRILRGLRFASQLGFDLEKDTEEATFAQAELLEEIAGERIRVEMEKLLCGSAVHDVLMRYVDVLGVVIPELLPMKGLDQRTRYHVYDVLEHSAYVIQNAPAYPLVRWAAFFHDMGKPDSFSLDDQGRGHMYGHPEVSAAHLGNVAKRLRFPNRLTHRIDLLVRYHDLRPANTPKSIRKLYAKLDYDESLFHAMCDLMRADALSQAPFCEERVHLTDDLEATFNTMIADEQCFSLDDLDVSGRDIIALGVKQGPAIGKVLDILLEAVIDEKIKPDRASLLSYAESVIGSD